MSASTEEATWVLTSYLVANAIILPATGWAGVVFWAQAIFDRLHHDIHMRLDAVRGGDEPETC